MLKLKGGKNMPNKINVQLFIITLQLFNNKNNYF